jgi:hypothetical protein
MSEADLRRLRNDLETMRQAAGLTLPFDWPDVWLMLGLIPAGAILAAWATFGAEQYLVAGMAPALLLALASGFRWGRRWRKEEGRVAWRRETAFAWTSAILFGVGILAYILWGRSAGLSVAGLKGAGMAAFGLVCGVLALSNRARRYYLAGALVLIPLGLIIPFCSSRQTLIAGGVALMAAGLMGGLIQAWQLRAVRRDHERTTD